MWGNVEVEHEQVVETNPNIYMERAEVALKQNLIQEALEEVDRAIHYAEKKNRNKYIQEKIKICKSIGNKSLCKTAIESMGYEITRSLTGREFEELIRLYGWSVNSNAKELLEYIKKLGLPAIISTIYKDSNFTQNDYLRGQAERYYENRNYKQAIELCQLAKKRLFGNTRDDRFDVLMSRCLRGQGDYQRAIDVLKGAIERSPDVDWMKELLEIYKEIKDYDKIVVLAKRILDINLDQAVANSLLVAYDTLKAYDEGLEYFKGLLHIVRGNQNVCEAFKAAVVTHIIRLHDMRGDYIASWWYIKSSQLMGYKLYIPPNLERQRYIRKTGIVLTVISILLGILLVSSMTGYFITTEISGLSTTYSNVAVNTNKKYLSIGESMKINVTYDKIPADGKEPELSFKSNDENIATVNEFGQVTGTGEGSTEILVYNYDELWDTVNVNVVLSTQVEIKAPEILEVAYQDLGNLEYEIVSEIPLEESIRFESSNTDVIEIDDKGNWIAKGLGECKVSIEVRDTVHTTQFRVTPILEEVSLVEAECEIEKGQTKNVTPIIKMWPTYATAPTIFYGSTNSEVIQVDSLGNVQALEEGNAEIMITVGDITKRLPIKVVAEKEAVLPSEPIQETTNFPEGFEGDYTSYDNDIFQFSIEYPTYLDNDWGVYEINGIELMSPDRECEVVVKAYTNTYDATVEEVYQSLINNTEEILYNRQKDNWYVFSWIEGQTMFYRKEVIYDNIVYRYQISYPAEDEKQYDSIVEHMYASFNTPKEQ